MEHRGEILEKAVRGKKYSITDLAKGLKISRPHVYNLFARSDLNTDVLLKAGKIIDYDFRPELKIFKDPQSKYKKLSKEAKDWKEKYFKLLKAHNELKKKFDQINQQ